jgi:hypothetical protein
MPVHPVDANTLGCWRFNENSEAPATFADEVGSYPLTVSGAAYPTYMVPRFTIAHFSQGGVLQHAGDAALRAAGLGDLTWEGWLKPSGGMSLPMALCQIGDETGGDNGASNMVFSARLTGWSGGYYNLVVQWQTQNHWTNNYVNCGYIIQTYEAGGFWVHLAVVRSGVNILVYVNGALVFTGAGSTAPNYNGQTPTSRLLVCPGYIGAIDDSRLSSIARTANEIATDATARDYPAHLWAAKSPLLTKSGYFQVVQRRSSSWGGGPYRKGYRINYIPPTVVPVIPPPVVSGFNPPPGTGILATTPISFVVSDPVGLQLIMVVADFARLGLREVIHDGTAFGPAYKNARCVRTAGTNSFSYTVLRTGGWPESPTLTPYVVDTAGKENV